MTAPLLSPRPLAPSIDALIEGHDSRLAMIPLDSKSGARFEWVVIGGERMVLKYQDARDDWLMRATGDLDGRRFAALWESGLLDAMPDVIDHAVVGAAAEGSVAAILLRDVSEWLLPLGDVPLSVESHLRFLDHIADLHARFWGWTDEVGAALQLSRKAQSTLGTGDAAGTANLLAIAGRIAHADGDLDSAEADLGSATADSITSDGGGPEGVASIWFGWVLADRGELDRARKLVEQRDRAASAELSSYPFGSAHRALLASYTAALHYETDLALATSTSSIARWNREHSITSSGVPTTIGRGYCATFCSRTKPTRSTIGRQSSRLHAAFVNRRRKRRSTSPIRGCDAGIPTTLLASSSEHSRSGRVTRSRGRTTARKDRDS
jgi:hypothetical protein